MTGENMENDFEKRMQQWCEAIVQFGKKLAETLKPLFQAIQSAEN